jgi:predicted esterase
VIERTVATTIHGRYLVVPPSQEGPAPVLAGFHGYAEDADAQIERLRAIPGSHRWLLVSIQALHRFYRPRTNGVVASWMTRQDRESAIADNISYVNTCLETVTAAWPTIPKVIFAGFSQGVAMAFRAAVNATDVETGVIAVGGDVPPEIGPAALQRISSALLVRGINDNLYTKEQFCEDHRRLGQGCGDVRVHEFDAGHEWSTDVGDAASRMLADFHPCL